MGTDLVTALAVGAGSLAGWAALYGTALLSTRPAHVEPDPPTQEFGGVEPPAVVNLLANRWRVTGDAAGATLLDLAARGYLELRQADADPAHTTVHLRGRDPYRLLPYERRVLDHVTALATDGVVPLAALAFRDPGQAARWSRRLGDEIVAGAHARNLSRSRLPIPLVQVLAGAAVLAGVGVAVAVGYAGAVPAVVVFAGAAAAGLLATVALRPHGERDTPKGRAIAARWLGVRRYLRADDGFATLPPAAVAVWDGYLGYGVALGAAPVCSRLVDFGIGDRKRLWSAFGGSWHRVRVRYPRFSMRYGRPAWRIAVWALLAAAAGAVLLGLRFGPAGPGRVLLGAGLVGWGGYRLVRTALDVALPVTVTGEVLCLRPWRWNRGTQDDPPEPWLYRFAVDDGRRSRTTAWGLPVSTVDGFDSGDVVTVKGRRWSRRVLGVWLVRSAAGTRVAAGAGGHAREPDWYPPRVLGPLGAVVAELRPRGGALRAAAALGGAWFVGPILIGAGGFCFVFLAPSSLISSYVDTSAGICGAVPLNLTRDNSVDYLRGLGFAVAGPLVLAAGWALVGRLKVAVIWLCVCVLTVAGLGVTGVLSPVRVRTAVAAVSHAPVRTGGLFPPGSDVCR